MTSGFSESTEYFLRQYDVFHGYVERFHNELGGLFRQVGDAMRVRGFASYIWRLENGRHILQLSRPNWFNDPNGMGIHYEFFVDPDELAARRLIVGLDISDEVPEAEAVTASLTRLLEPHEEYLLKEGCELCRGSDWKLVYTTLPLRGLSLEAMEAKCALLPDVAALVDEALFLSDKKMIWRTDFFSNNPSLALNWFGNQGGQEITRGAGRLGSAALKIDGTRPNARPQEQGCYSVLVQGTHDIRNSGEHYACVVLRSRAGGSLRIRGEGHKEPTTRDGKRSFPRAFSWSRDIQPADRWQCVSFQDIVPSAEEADYDFAEQGTWIVMNVQTEDTDFLIDSIEIGTIGEED
jgi:hypothetical protein